MFRAIHVSGAHLITSLLVGILVSPLAAQPPDGSRLPSAGNAASPAPVPSPAAAGTPAQGPPPATAGLPASPEQGPAGGTQQAPAVTGRPSQARIALNRAIEFQRRGDYEAASPLFHEAQLRQADLSLKEQRDLAQLMQDNTQALLARRDALENLRQAEKASAEGRPEEVAARLRCIAVNEQYLLPQDRQQYQTLTQSVRRSVTGRPDPASGPKPSSPAGQGQLARDKVKQARMLLGQYQFDAAEALAQEADRMSQLYNRGEDTPRDVLRDVARARTDPRTLVTAARAALERKDLDRAEQYAQLASRVQSGWSLQLWGDSPAKVLKDVQTARAEQKDREAGPPATASLPTAPQQSPAAAPNSSNPPKEGGMLSWLNPFGGKGKSDSPASAGDKENGKPGDRKTELAGSSAPRTTEAPASMPRALVRDVPASARREEAAGHKPAGKSDAAEGLRTTAATAEVPPPAESPVKTANLQLAQAGSRTPPEAAKPATVPSTTANKPATAGPPAPAEPAPAPPGPGDANETEAARNLITQARQALQQGNFAQARTLNEQARQRKANLAWWEDNPDRIQSDLVRMEAQAQARQEARNGRSAGGAGVEAKRKDEAENWLRQGRAQLAEGKIDEATQSMLKAKGISVTRWGMFEDNPDKLRQDLDKARAKRDQEESVRVLAEARRLYEAGDLDNALRAAYRAQKLHGTYTIWDLGDRPSKLLADIEAARQKQKLLANGKKIDKGPVQASRERPRPENGPGARSDSAVQQASATGQNSQVQQASTPRGDPQLADARQFLADARQAVQKGDIAQARVLADHVRTMNVRFNPGEETPETIYRDIDLIAKGQKPTATAATAALPAAPPNGNPVLPQAPPVPPVSPAGLGPVALASPANPAQTPVMPAPPPGMPAPPSAGLPAAPQPGMGGPASAPQGSAPDMPQQPNLALRKAQAQQLLAQARALQKAGQAAQLIQARALALEAQKLGASFGPMEDSPELALQQMAAQARQSTDFLIRNGYEVAMYGKGPEAKRYEVANQCFQDARRLATAFGQDLQPVDNKLAWLANLRNGQPGTAIAQGPVPGSSNPGTSQAQQWLNDARRDLKAGDTASARKKAMDAAQDQNARDQALTLIRTIDAEEDNQRLLEQQRGFDAAYAAYLRRDYAHARKILAYVEPRQLDNERRERLRNMMNTSEMSPTGSEATRAVAFNDRPGAGDPSERRGGSPPGAPQAGVGLPLGPVPGARTDRSTNVSLDMTGHDRATDMPKPSLLETTQAMREIRFQQLRQESIRIQAEAGEKFKLGQTEEAMELLQNHLNELVAETGLDPAKMTLLKRPVESRIQQYSVLKTQKDFLAGQKAVKDNAQVSQARKARAEDVRQKKVTEMLKQFNQFYKEGKYEEARTAALKAKELDPDNETAGAAILIADRQQRIVAAKTQSSQKEKANLEQLNQVEDPPSVNAIRTGIDFDPKRWEVARKRGSTVITNSRKSEREREIEHRLNTDVTLNFTDTPLSKVLDDIRSWQGINIWVDKQALDGEGINPEQLVNIKVEGIKLRSALTLLLKTCRLTYMVDKDVVQITTENEARGKLETRTFLVADLVIPITDFGRLGSSPLSPWNAPTQTSQPTVPPSPIEGRMSLQNGTPVGNPSPMYATTYGNNSPNISWGSQPTTPAVKVTPPTQTQEQMLIELIKHTIAPRTWSDLGGPGSIDYFPLTMSLVINQTQDIQEQIQDLLQALRRLQDQEVAVEVKVVSLAEDFFEQIGVQFTMNIPTNSRGLAQQVAQGYTPNKLVSGITPAGNLTNDLSIPITNNNFVQSSIPFFGNSTGVPGFGGVTMGLAYLSDLQVFLFMEAAQGDSRTNVMQAPKITLFNGQTATLTVNEQAPFVTNVTAIVQNGLVLFTPTITPLISGVNLTLQAVITGDRRFVRMSMFPTFTVPVPGPPSLFPIVVPVFPQQQIGPGNSNPIIFTQYIQLPAFNTITVGTTVMVPDGGTVVMGGLKLLSEARNELGPPILSKLPYINRLFRNQAYGKDTSSLLIMVTPRIIIMEEEQEYQTGFVQPTTPNP